MADLRTSRTRRRPLRLSPAALRCRGHSASCQAARHPVRILDQSYWAWDISLKFFAKHEERSETCFGLPQRLIDAISTNWGALMGCAISFYALGSASPRLTADAALAAFCWEFLVGEMSTVLTSDVSELWLSSRIGWLSWYRPAECSMSVVW